MANEILVLTGDRNQRYDVLMLFPIASPAQAGGANVTPTPSAELEPSVRALLDPAEVTALDGGTMVYRRLRLKKQEGLTAAGLATRLRAVYAEQAADVAGWYATRYAHVGTRVDA